MKRENIKFGLIPDEYDERDFKFVPRQFFELPLNVNLSFVNPNVYDQLTLGSCVFNAYGSMFQGRLRRQGQDFIPSRLFPYYNYRESIGKINEDTGASMREGVKIYAKYGVVPETEWPYDKKLFKTKPTKECYEHALNHQVIEYSRVEHDLYSMKACLAAADTFVGGIAIYESFMSDIVKKTGKVELPKGNEQLLGYHAIEMVGYYSKWGWFCKNSWGTEWGIRGYFILPWDYLLSKELSMDFLTITMVETT